MNRWPPRFLVMYWSFFVLAGVFSPLSVADPTADLRQYQSYFKDKFPKLKLAKFAEGVYAIDPILRQNWESVQDFPPYEPYVDAGQKAYAKTLRNGKTYEECLPKGGIGKANLYPFWDAEAKSVITLPLAINICRIKNGDPPLPYEKGKLISIVAYLMQTSRGTLTQIEVPDDSGALAAYAQGKKYYFTRRGQLNFACNHCHFENAGKNLRADRLSPALGQTTNWPAYRAKWGELGSLHRRFISCNKQVRATPFKAQSEAYRNLEYFLTFMSNGIPLNGPDIRR